MTVRMVESPLEKTARMVADQHGIRVVFAPGQCHTDGKTITLPSLPENASKEAIKAANGHLDHEVGHCLYSDFEVIKRNAEQKKVVQAQVLNVLEDIREEHRLYKEWPGCRRNINYSGDVCMKEITAIDPKTGKNKYEMSDDLYRLTVPFILAHMTNFDMEYFMFKDGFVSPAHKQCLIDNKDFVSRARDCSSTEEANTLAVEFMARLGLKEVEQPPQMSKEDFERAMKEFSEKSEKGEPCENPCTQDISTEFCVKNSDGSAIEGKVSVKQMNETALAVSKEGMLKAAAKQENKFNKDPYSVATTENDKVVAIESATSDRSKFAEIDSQTGNRARVVKRRIARALMTETYTRWENEKTRGKLNRRALHRVAQGTSNRVFRQKGVEVDFDTTVMLLIDHSGSMCGQKALVATQTAILMGDVLNSLEIPFSVVGFSTGEDSTASDVKRNLGGTFTRYGALRLFRYKNFQDTWSFKKFRVSQIQNNIKVNTYDGESVRWGVRQLLSRPEKRKILILLNDGQPCPNYSDNMEAHTTFAKEVGAIVGKYVDFVAVGIDSGSMGEFYKNHINISNIDEIGGTVLNELVKFLKPKAAR